MLSGFVLTLTLLCSFFFLVSDSYDFALIRSDKLFQRARCEETAKLVAVGASNWQSLPVRVTVKVIRAVVACVQSSLLFLFGAPDSADGEDEDSNWQGRALDTERRTRRAVESSRRLLENRLEDQDRKLREMESRLEASNEGLTGAVVEATLSMETKLDARLGALEATIAALIVQPSSGPRKPHGQSLSSHANTPKSSRGSSPKSR